MFKRLRPRTRVMYNKSACAYSYIVSIERALNSLNEILENLELNDRAFTKEYTMYLRQWNALERAFFKILKLQYSYKR